MDHLRIDQFESALRLLRRAEDELERAGDFANRQKLTAITLNNLGCFYKRTRRPTIALHYLRRALEVENTPPVDHANLAGTHLNICAIRSSLGAHEKALEHARKAIRLLVANYDSSPNAQTTLVIAYHNAGIEYEFLQRFAEASESYKQGYELSRQQLGVSHPLTQNLRRSCLQQAEDRRSERDSRRSLGSGRGEYTPNRSEIRPHSNGQRRTPSSRPLPRISTAPRKKRRRNLILASAAPQSLELSRQINQSSISTESKQPSGTNLSQESDSIIGGNIRYITGDRLKPMHKEGFGGPASGKSRPTSRAAGKPSPPSLRPESKSFRTRIFEIKQSKQAEDMTETRIQSIDEKLTKLQTALKEFEASSQATQAAAAVPLYTKLDRSQAAVVIQKTVRGFIARKKYMRVQGQPQPTTLSPAVPSITKPGKTETQGPMKLIQVPTIPTKPKGIVFKRKALPSSLFPIEEKDRSEEESVVVIQSWVRMFVTRRRYLRQRAAAVVIQKHIRRFQCRRLYLSIREAVICLQVGVRRWLVGRFNPIS